MYQEVAPLTFGERVSMAARPKSLKTGCPKFFEQPVAVWRVRLLHDLGHGRLTDSPVPRQVVRGRNRDRRGCSRPPPYDLSGDR
jgi:hypothetical protein